MHKMPIRPRFKTTPGDDVDPADFDNHNLNRAASSDRAWLAALAALLVVAGVGLAKLAGPPRLPTELPSAESVLQMLSGSSVPLQGLALVLIDVAWLAWAWTVLSLVLELLVLAAELMAYGRGWVGTLRQVADRMSVPLVRRTVAAAFAVQVLGRTVSVAAAQPLPPADPIVLARSAEATDPTVTNAEAPAAVATPTYMVRPGDTLWSIAEQAYGSGVQYRRLVDANVGRSMADGQVFSGQGVIQPGWLLLAPGATWDTDAQDGERWYTVQPGDSLSSIAATLLGDTARWEDVFALNRGAASPDGQHTLVEPNTIWPGLRLQLPDGPPTTSASDSGADPVAAEDANPPVTELLVASAPAPVADAAHAVTADPVASTPPQAATPPQSVESMAAPPPRAAPLLRTSHALQPVVLDPADSAAADLPPSDAQPADPIPAASPLADAEVSVPPSPATPSIPTLPLAVGGLGLLGIAGLAFGARRWRRLRPLPHEPESDVVVQGGFAEAQLAHDLTRGLHGMGFDPLTALVGQLELFLREYNLADVEVVAARHGRSSTSLTLRCGLAQQPILLDIAVAFAERLEADVEAAVSADQDVVLRLVRLRKTRLLPTADQVHEKPCLVELGVLYDRQVYWAAWRSLGHVLVVSLPGHGAETILASLVATVAARRSPEQLRIWMLGSPRAMPAPLFDFPHVVRRVDPGDADALTHAVEQFRAEVDRRTDTAAPQPELLVVVPELGSLGEHAATLALLAARAAQVGVYLAVACTDPEGAADNPLTSCFSTRMVLRMQTEEASVALLGVADAAFLGGGGRLLLRLDGREPVELYGYQVSAEHLDRLLKMMRTAYPVAAPAPPAAPDVRPGPQQPAPVPPSESPDLSETIEPAAPRPPGPAETDTLPPDACNGIEPSAPVQIRCFGLPHVLCRGEHVWPRGGGDAKPWELLLYLACQQAEGVPREAAMEALWPDAEARGLADDVNHRLRQLRYRLRRQLQQVPEPPESDGVCMDRRGLRLDPAIVYSDAQEFLELERDARTHPDPHRPEAIAQLERMRALYVGDLLDGPDVRRYAWVDERDDSGVTLREHFRKLYQNACTRLAEAYTAAGRVEEAIEAYHDLTDMDPGDERLFAALFRLCAANGGLADLEAEHDRMLALLRDLALDLDPADPQVPEPDAALMEEYRRLRASLLERSAERERARDSDRVTATV
jgi:DNA-binding SARP family transcriptional activator